MKPQVEVTAEGLEMVAPLIRRASSFGPYFWLFLLAYLVSNWAVSVATGSLFAGALFAAVGCFFINHDAADREYTIEKWLSEVADGLA